MIDGKDATQKVREYFLAAHGEWGFIGFQVEHVAFDKQEKVWLVRGSFFPSLAAQQRVLYEVKVSEEGEITEVQRPTPQR